MKLPIPLHNETLFHHFSYNITKGTSYHFSPKSYDVPDTVLTEYTCFLTLFSQNL